jgi:Uma2 family endonuclease
MYMVSGKIRIMTLAEHDLQTIPRPHRWTFDDYMRASDAGSFDSQRVELIEGEVIDMPAQKDPHAWTISRLVKVLLPIFPDPYWVKIQATQRLSDISGPEPDVAVMSGPPSPPATEPPTPLLVIEVSETTLRYDRGDKASLYAKYGIADYWVVNVISRQVEVFRNPVRDSSKRYGWGYGSPVIFNPPDRIVPLCKPDVSLEVSSFLG